MDTAQRPTETLAARRRSLHFDDLTQVLNDVRRMNAGINRSLGRWTLAQVCKHLADSINGSIDGLNLSRHRFKRWFFAKRMLAWTLENGIPPGVTVDPVLTPPSDAEWTTAFAELHEAIRRYCAHPGPLRAHPLFGKLDRLTWDRLHCFHCAHHLSLIVAVENGDRLGTIGIVRASANLVSGTP